MEKSNPSDKVVFFEVDQTRWPDFEKLFESRGGPKNCWCMVWRGKSEDRKNKENKKSAIKKMVQGNVPIGILGYVGGGAQSLRVQLIVISEDIMNLMRIRIIFGLWSASLCPGNFGDMGL
jgi:hypothetical protein